MSDAPASLNGNCGSFLDNSRVKIIGTDMKFNVVYGFFMLNADNAYSVCYLLKDDDAKTLFCPHVFLEIADNVAKQD